MDSLSSAPAKPSTLDWIFRVLGFLAMTAVAFSVPLFPTMELDSSWRMAIGRFLME
ncbi:MAG: hypothetical protein JWQ62_1524, partial [Lacunisphaera sp.]|nr:hypothetical protein [Lacunisphaera sp.]